MDAVLALFQRLSPLLVYLALGVGSALENVIPPIPADTFVLLGGFLAARGVVSAPLVFLVTWGANVASALGMFWVGATHGPGFFDRGWGRHLLRPEQRKRMSGFYDRWGVLAVFLARFLPGLRAVVPVTAGLARISGWKVAVPLAAASALWYGTLVWLGTIAGRNLERVQSLIDRANLVLLGIAAILFVAIGLWWWRTRGEVGR